MQEAALTEWLRSRGTQLLLVYLRHRQATVLRTFLQGHPVTPTDQGRVAALHELETLLAGPAEQAERVLNEALKLEQKL